MNKKFKQYFDELETQAEQLKASRKMGKNGFGSEIEFVDDNLLLNWKVKVKNLLSKLCGEESQYFQEFEKNEDEEYITNYLVD